MIAQIAGIKGFVCRVKTAKSVHETAKRHRIGGPSNGRRPIMHAIISSLIIQELNEQHLCMICVFLFIGFFEGIKQKLFKLVE